jgi:hypothetical protein
MNWLPTTGSIPFAFPAACSYNTTMDGRLSCSLRRRDAMEYRVADNVQLHAALNVLRENEPDNVSFYERGADESTGKVDSLL